MYQFLKHNSISSYSNNTCNILVIKSSLLILCLRVLGRLESIMLQNLPIMLFGISLIFCLLCLFLCFLDMDYADISLSVILQKMIMIAMNRSRVTKAFAALCLAHSYC